MVETLRPKLLGITLGDFEAEALVVVLAEAVAEIKAKTLSDTLGDQSTYRHAGLHAKRVSGQSSC